MSVASEHTYNFSQIDSGRKIAHPDVAHRMRKRISDVTQLGAVRSQVDNLKLPSRVCVAPISKDAVSYFPDAFQQLDETSAIVKEAIGDAHAEYVDESKSVPRPVDGHAYTSAAIAEGSVVSRYAVGHDFSSSALGPTTDDNTKDYLIATFNAGDPLTPAMKKGIREAISPVFDVPCYLIGNELIDRNLAELKNSKLTYDGVVIAVGASLAALPDENQASLRQALGVKEKDTAKKKSSSTASTLNWQAILEDVNVFKRLILTLSTLAQQDDRLRPAFNVLESARRVVVVRFLAVGLGALIGGESNIERGVLTHSTSDKVSSLFGAATMYDQEVAKMITDAKNAAASKVNIPEVAGVPEVPFDSNQDCSPHANLMRISLQFSAANEDKCVEFHYRVIFYLARKLEFEIRRRAEAPGGTNCAVDTYTFNIGIDSSNNTPSTMMDTGALDADEEGMKEVLIAGVLTNVYYRTLNNDEASLRAACVTMLNLSSGIIRKDSKAFNGLVHASLERGDSEITEGDLRLWEEYKNENGILDCIASFNSFLKSGHHATANKLVQTRIRMAQAVDTPAENASDEALIGTAAVYYSMKMGEELLSVFYLLKNKEDYSRSLTYRTMATPPGTVRYLASLSATRELSTLFGLNYKFGNFALKDIVRSTEAILEQAQKCAPYRRYLYGIAPAAVPQENTEVQLGLVLSSALNDAVGSSSLSSAISYRVKALEAATNMRLTNLVARGMLGGVERAAREIGQNAAKLALKSD